MRLKELDLDGALSRRQAHAADPETQRRVAAIIDRVRTGGGAEVARIAGELGDPEPRLLDRAAMEKAARDADADLRATLERTVERVRRVAEAQAPERLRIVEEKGVRTTLRCTPVERAACYAPAGRHPLVSSAVMTVVPARVAGVDEVVVVSPGVSSALCAAAVASGADGYLVLGGAQAVAACAFGVSPAEGVDVFVGPGNKYVAEAKRQCFGVIGVEGVAGPSEVLVVASGSADPRLVAVDLLAQAEHDEDAEAILLLPGDAALEPIERALDDLLGRMSTRGTAEASLARRGGCIRYDDLDEAIRIIDQIAPEHLALHLAEEEARATAECVRHAGAIFVGAASGEALGDYGAGPNHTLPTGGAARFQQGLSPSIFLKQRAELEILRADETLTGDVERLAEVEGLDAHRLAATLRRGGARTPG